MSSPPRTIDTFSVYIPMDRRQVLARGITLPDRLHGAALFADISGFTPLTEALVRELGPQRGAEELTHHLNLVYDALVTELHRYGGSVISFSGDAITCWLDGDTGLRATACALAMQKAMAGFASVAIPSGKTVSLAMKAAVATGSARRFVVGDPKIQLIDVLAGVTLDCLVAAEHQARKGEVVLDPAAVASLAGQVRFAAWRDDGETGRRFGVVEGLVSPIAESPWPPLPGGALSEKEVRPWLLPPVYQRLKSGQGEFLAELRPAVALFLRFGGIDYDEDEEAGAKLNAYISWVQSILTRYEGTALQLTIGDKGSYLYAAFGAPLAHEDDAARAVSAALDLRQPPPDLDFIGQVQIGLSQGRMRTGSYGGTQRHTYGVLGDDVNLAARLMQAAGPGQIFVSQTVRQAAADTFAWARLPALNVKGKAEPVMVFSVDGLRERRSFRLQEPDYDLPMVGREAELALAEDRLAEALARKGQFIGIMAAAGMGKSRLVAEIIRLARSRGLTGYGGECQSYGQNISYLVWQPIWRGFFGLDPAWEVADQIKELEKQLTRIDPALLPRLPLLGAVLNLSIPDNELTQTFDAKLRKTSLESLLVDCLRARATETPLLIVLEDCHWLDPLSLELLEVIGPAVVDLPVLVVLAYRPPELQHLRPPWAAVLPRYTEITLEDFTPDEAQQLIRLKLAQFSDTEGEIPPDLVERITSRAQGNPFYIEELLNYLRDRGIDPRDSEALTRLDLPASLHSLILSRIDQLSESQKITMKIASVIGRLFRAQWLWGMYPELGQPERVKSDLEALNRLDLTPMDTPEPELLYLFKHIVTQEVAYESLPYAMRALLHDQLGRFIERRYRERIDEYIDLLAFHYERSENEAKKREYLLKAGQAAQADYANEAAIDYFQRVLPLLPSTEKVAVMLKLGEVLVVVGRWDEAGTLYEESLALAEQLDDRPAQASCQTAMGELLWKKGLYAEALAWLERAQTGFEALDDPAGVALVLHRKGTLAAQQGDYEAARARWNESLAIRQRLDDQPGVASLLSNLGIIAQYQGDNETARQLYEQGLAIRDRLGDKWAIAVSLDNLGYLDLGQGNYEAARRRLEEAVSLQREVGDRYYLANALNNLGNAVRGQGDYETARALYAEGLAINRTLGDHRAIAYLLEDIGCLAVLQGRPRHALRLTAAAEVLREAAGAPLAPTEREDLERRLAPAHDSLGEAGAASALAEGSSMSLEQAIEQALEPRHQP
ncbi:MAG: tetratricopeptide repeat protein [Anaerolineae bacterium]